LSCPIAARLQSGIVLPYPSYSCLSNHWSGHWLGSTSWLLSARHLYCMLLKLYDLVCFCALLWKSSHHSA